MSRTELGTFTCVLISTKIKQRCFNANNRTRAYLYSSIDPGSCFAYSATKCILRPSRLRPSRKFCNVALILLLSVNFKQISFPVLRKTLSFGMAAFVVHFVGLRFNCDMSSSGLSIWKYIHKNCTSREVHAFLNNISNCFFMFRIHANLFVAISDGLLHTVLLLIFLALAF